MNAAEGDEIQERLGDVVRDLKFWSMKNFGDLKKKIKKAEKSFKQRKVKL